MTDIDDVTSRVIMALSVECGQDLTPHGDLEERLEQLCFQAHVMAQSAEEFQAAVRAYELTVEGHTPVVVRPLASS